HPVAPLRQFAVVGAAEHQLVALAASPEQATGHVRAHLHAGQGGEARTQLANHFRRAFVAFAPVLEEHDHVAGVHFLAAAPTARDPRIGAFDRAITLHVPGEDPLDLLHLADHVVESRAFGRIHADEEAAAVLGGRQFTGD